MEIKDKRKNTIMKLIKDPMYTPMKIKEIIAVLGITSEDRPMLDKIIDELIAEGKIVRNKRGRFILPQIMSLTPGTFIGHNKGFGFVRPEEGDDIFIPASAVNGAMHQDKVLCKITSKSKSGKRCEGEIAEVLERGATTIIGIYEEGKNFGFVVPDETKYANDIYIAKNKKRGAVSGHKVLVKITKWDKEKNPEGEVIKILGHVNDPGVDILSICYQYNLPIEFGDDVLREVERISDTVQDVDKRGRLDLRDVMMVTIDGEDAKDLDDAVSLEVLDNGLYRLGVHIADVTNYVKQGSPLDAEAYERATSVYLVDRVIPMLPHKLSNGICSLNAGVDRLALSCIMDIDKSGNVMSHQIAETTICVDERMTYTNVKKILEDNDEELISLYKPYVPMFREMEKLAQYLRTKRFKRGAIDFDFPETKVVLDETGYPVELKRYDRNVATKLIEEFMLVCNETVAEQYFWLDRPFVYRIHENPDPERILSLVEMLKGFGYNLPAGKVHPKNLQTLLERIKDTPEEAAISQLMLRSMKQAKYSPDCLGHFGLSTKYYSHFTSPIRRYPDLQIHRLIKEKCQNVNLDEVCKHTSMRERRAEEAERETIKLKKVEYMENKIGQIFEGTISGVMSWGIYVELENTIEGLVHISTMNDDYYHFVEQQFKYVGETTGKTYSLGDKVQVRVTKIDKTSRTIDFYII